VVDSADDRIERARDRARTANHAVLVFDAGGRIVGANQRCVVVFERDADAFEGETVEDLIEAAFLDPEFEPTYERALGRLGPREGSGQASFRTTVYPGSGGNELPYSVDVDVVRSDGAVVGHTVSFGALGTVSRYEDTLEALHEATRDLFAADSELSVYDRAGRAANDILGFPGTGIRTYDADAETLRHVTFGKSVTHIDGRPPYDVPDSPHGRAFESGEVQIEPIDETDPYDRQVFSHVMYVPIGREGLISLGTVGERFADTDVRFAELLADNAAAALREVRNRERLEAQRARLERYETVVETLADPVYAVADDGRITFANSAFEQLFDCDTPGDAGLDIQDVATDGDRLVDHVERMRRRSDVPDTTSLEIVATSGGGERRLDASVALLNGETEAVATGVLTDVTERERRQEVLTVLNRVLRHNLRTKVNTITGYADLLREEGAEAEDGPLAEITAAAEWLAKLGDTLRALQRAILEGGDEYADADTLVSGTVEKYCAEHPAATIEVEGTADCRLSGGRSLQFALDHVVENAIVHHDGDHPSVTVTVDDRSRGRVAIAVRDDGPGIPAAERDLVMGETEITQLQHGSGVGLWTTRWLVEAFDGDLDIEDAEPRGTVVTLSWPRARVD